MSSAVGRRVRTAAMAAAAVLIVGAGTAAVMGNSDAVGGGVGGPTGDNGQTSVATDDGSGGTDGQDGVGTVTPGDNGPATAKTLYGASFAKRPGEKYHAALRRTDATLGRLGVVRVFYRRQPRAWPGKAPGRDVIVSFRLDPALVLAGEYDAYMRNWFATVPIGLNVFWTNYHEPEDEIDNGKFTAAQFRDSFAHLDQLADEAHNPRLRSTVILMSWTARPASGRKWRAYVPDPANVDVLAWDIYNRRRDVYPDPAALLEAAEHDSETIGKPFAVAELASVLAKGDKGSGRADWLRAMGEFAKEHNAAFVSYFDYLWNNGTDDFRLMDDPSIQAWKEISGRG
jgi:hypothetical protein